MPTPDSKIPCHLCGSTTAPKADAHIFPKAIFKRVKVAQGKADHLLAIDRDGSKPPARVRIGVYDNTILCAGCEHQYHGIDTRGIEALLHAPYKRLPTYGKAQLLAGYSDQANARDIRTFLYYTLLRAGWSKREAYAHVELAPDVEEHLRRTVIESVEPESLHIPIFLIRHGRATPGFIPTPTLYHGTIMTYPKAGHAIYQVSVHDFCALVFAGKHAPTFGRTSQLSLQDGKRVHLLRSPDLDEAMEDWVAGLVADRLRTGGKKWDQ